MTFFSIIMFKKAEVFMFPYFQTPQPEMTHCKVTFVLHEERGVNNVLQLLP